MHRGFPWRKVLPYAAAQVAGAFAGVGADASSPTARPSTASTAACGRSRARRRRPASSPPTRSRSCASPAGWSTRSSARRCSIVADLRDRRRARTSRPTGRLAPVLVGRAGGRSSACRFGFNAGYAINPARDLGPRLFTLVAGWGRDVFRAGHGWWWVPIAGPLVGGVARRPRLRPVHDPPPSSREPDGRRRREVRPGARPGHDLQPGDRVRPRRPQRSPPRSRSSRRSSRRRATSSTTRRRSGRRSSRSRARCLAKASVGSGGHRRDRHHQPARDDDPLGARHRQAGGQRDRLAEPRQRADLRRAEGRRPRADCSASKTGLVVDAYFSGTKIKHLLDTVPGLRARAEAGEILFGTVDTFLIWRLTGGKRARHRRQQRQPHAAVQHPHARLGRRAADDPRRAARACCPRCRRRARSTARREATLLRRRRSRSPASPATSRRRTFGQACFAPGTRQEHLRHRLLPAAQHRRAAGGLAERPADDDRLADGRRSRRTAWKARCSSPARWCSGCATGCGVISRSADVEKLAAQRARRRRRLPRAGVRRPRRAATGTPTRAARSSA